MALGALVLSFAYHLQLRLAGEIAIESLTSLLNEEIRGEISIGELHNVSFQKIVAEDVVVRDGEGRVVIQVARVAAWPDWGALGRGVIRVGRVRLRGGEVTLFVAGEESDTVSIATAFQPARPSTGPSSEPPRVIVDDIVLDDVLVRGDVPGLRGLRVEELRVHGRVEAQRDVRFIVWDARGVLSAPYEGRTSIDRVVGYFDSDLASEGLEFFARAHRGDDRVRARIRLRRPDPDAPAIMELRVRAEPLRVSTLAEMGIAQGLESITATVRGGARLFGPTDRLALRADLHAEAGSVRVLGLLPAEGPLVIDARTERMRLDRLLVRGPDLVAAGRARIEIEEDPSGSGTQVRRLHADLEPSRLGTVEIPAFTMDGMLEDDALRIVTLEADHAGGETRVSGRVGFDGSLDVHVSARLPDIAREPNVRREVGDASGALTAEVDVRADEGAENLRFDGHVLMRELRYGSVRAGRLSVRGHGGGSLPMPRLELRGDADGLRVGALSLGHAEVTIRGGPAGYELTAESRDLDAGARAAVAGRATLHDETWRILLPEVRLELGPDVEPWRGSADLRFRPGQSIELAPVVLARGNERIGVSGTYRFQGADALEVDLTNVELSGLRPLAPEALAGVSGAVSGRLELGGDLDRRPQGRLAVRIAEGAYRDVRGISGVVDLALAGDTLTTDVRLDLGDAGALAAVGPIRLPPAALRDPRRLLDQARFEGLRLRAADLDVAPLLAVAGIADDVRIVGRITTEAELTGTPREPGVRDALLVLDQVALEGWPPLRAKLHLGLGEERLTLRHVWVADAGGELATGEGDLPFPMGDLPSDLRGTWAILRAQPWSISLRLPMRRLDSWPEPLIESLPAGLAASASVTAGNRDGSITADVQAVARWVEAAVEDECAAELRPSMTIRGRVENELATATVTGFFGGERAELEADLAAELPFDEWVQRGGVSDFPRTELVARVRGVDMGRVPWLCSYGRGPIHGSLTAKDLLTGASVIGAVADMPALRIWEAGARRGHAQLSSPYRVHVRAGSSPERDALTACAILGISGQSGTEGARCREVPSPAEGELLSRWRVPVRWTAGELLPSLAQGGVITSWTGLEDVHVEPLLTLVPGIVSGDAVMNGLVRVSGPTDALRLEGSIDIAQGQLQIDGLGQHLHDIEGHLELRGDEAIFPEERPLSARDAGGRATAHGRIGFEGIVPRHVALEVRADEFPVRREGMVLAWLTGNANITGEIADEQTTSTIRTRGFSVRLPDQAGGALQPLGAHPEVLVVGQQRPAQTAQDEASYPVLVHVDARSPFWVRRTDFAAHVTADLRAEYREPNLYVGGEARILRGTFQIFGKRFELQDGSMTFDPRDPSLNPSVNITATYDVPARRGVTVTVGVTGTLTAPELTLTSTETNDRAEIIALLVSGGRRDAGAAERDASQAAASFLAGLTAGILTLGLREEFGNIIPVLAIESEGIGGTRVRLGFDANDLIPDFMRGFVTGAYIEGFFTAAADGAGTAAGPGGVGGGVTIEFTLPEGFLLRGTYVPVDNGSLDVLFELPLGGDGGPSPPSPTPAAPVQPREPEPEPEQE